MKHGIEMGYSITLEGLEAFWNASAGCSKHSVRACAIRYPLVKVMRVLGIAHGSEQGT